MFLYYQDELYMGPLAVDAIKVSTREDSTKYKVTHMKHKPSIITLNKYICMKICDDHLSENFHNI